MDYRRLLDPRERGVAARLLRSLLRLAAWPYGWAVRLRNWRYDHGWAEVTTLETPVISIGNLTAGGTGKTPLVAAVALHLRRRDRRVALISRGYRAEQSGSNDEARELYQRLPDVPHLQNPDRVAAGRTAIEELEMEVLVLDDGFQHRRLARQLDVVLIDATCPWGFGRLLPAGLLREPRSGLRRADFALISRVDRVTLEEIAQIETEIRRWAPGLPVAHCRHVPGRWLVHRAAPLPLEALRTGPALALAGIGNPAPFFDSLRELGLRLLDCRALPDHCGYDRHTVADLQRWVQQHATQEPQLVVVCTHKDLVKLRTAELGGRPLRALQVDLEISQGADRFWTAIDQAAGTPGQRQFAPAGRL
jgi:tetraacyldisaccharide 4'-kinase